jgi:tetratricopeptide (TPR) repeat protein
MPIRDKFQLLPYIEATVVLVFIALIFLYARKGESGAEQLSLSKVETLVKSADDAFTQKDLARAAIMYWQIIREIEAAKQQPSADSLDEILLHAHLRVAEIYFQSHWTEDAKKRLESASQIQPDHVNVRLLRGKLLRDEDKVAAGRELIAVVEKDPSNAEAHYLLGVLYQGARQFEDAVRHFKKAIEHDSELVKLPFESTPIGLQARLQLSRTYLSILQTHRFVDRELTAEEMEEIGQMEEQVVDVLKEAVAANPNFAEAKDALISRLYTRARMFEREGETRSYDKAIEVYKFIVELDAEEADAWSMMGERYLRFLQDPEAALEAYRKAYQLVPDPGLLAEIKNIEEMLETQKQENDTEE